MNRERRDPEKENNSPKKKKILFSTGRSSRQTVLWINNKAPRQEASHCCLTTYCSKVRGGGFGSPTQSPIQDGLYKRRSTYQGYIPLISTRSLEIEVTHNLSHSSLLQISTTHFQPCRFLGSAMDAWFVYRIWKVGNWNGLNVLSSALLDSYLCILRVFSLVPGAYSSQAARCISSRHRNNAWGINW